MKEFLEYDTMVAKHNENRYNTTLPLLSWEFYGEHHTALDRFRKDLNALRKIAKNWNFKRDYRREFIEEQSVIIVTNPDLKIIYASQNIHKLTGYSQDEVISNSPKMFQGKDTCLNTISKIRNAIDNGSAFEVSILNYRKDETPYICLIKGFPVYDKGGELVNYIAFEKAA